MSDSSKASFQSSASIQMSAGSSAQREAPVMAPEEPAPAPATMAEATGEALTAPVPSSAEHIAELMKMQLPTIGELMAWILTIHVDSEGMPQSCLVCGLKLSVLHNGIAEYPILTPCCGRVIGKACFFDWLRCDWHGHPGHKTTCILCRKAVVHEPGVKPSPFPQEAPLHSVLTDRRVFSGFRTPNDQFLVDHDYSVSPGRANAPSISATTQAPHLPTVAGSPPLMCNVLDWKKPTDPLYLASARPLPEAYIKAVLEHVQCGKPDRWMVRILDLEPITPMAYDAETDGQGAVPDLLLGRWLSSRPGVIGYMAQFPKNALFFVRESGTEVEDALNHALWAHDGGAEEWGGATFNDIKPLYLRPFGKTHLNGKLYAPATLVHQLRGLLRERYFRFRTIFDGSWERSQQMADEVDPDRQANIDGLFPDLTDPTVLDLVEPMEQFIDDIAITAMTELINDGGIIAARPASAHEL